MHVEDRRQLDRVSSLVREVLGEDVAGAYLFGSAVHGGLQPDSDLDVLVVSERHTTLEEKRRLVARLLSVRPYAGHVVAEIERIGHRSTL